MSEQPPPSGPPPNNPGGGNGAQGYGGGPGNGPSGYPTFPSGGGSQPPPSSKGFFGALFDFGFNHFITPIIVKVVYVLALIALVLGWLVLTISGLTQSAAAGLAILVLGAIGLIIYLAFIRMTLEFYLAIVRMSEDVHKRLPG